MVTRVSKNALHFDHLKIYRYPRVPRMDEGRNGDIILVDTLEGEGDPTNVGLWIKIPLTDVRAPIGTVVTGLPGAISTFNTITINSFTITLTDLDDRDIIADNINAAAVDDIVALSMGDTIQIVEATGGALTIGENSLGLVSSPPLSKLDTNGVWAPFRISGSSTYAAGAAQLFIESPEEKTYSILDLAVFGFDVAAITAKTVVGTIDLQLQINGVNVAGFPTIQATDTRQTVFATELVRVFTGNTLSVATSNNAGATDLSIMFSYKYRNA